jgi:tryptophan-rich sensory protein
MSSRTSTFGTRLIQTGAAAAVAATVGSLETDPESRWYKRLRKPSWQPSRVAFPIVWTSLYAGIAATSALVLRHHDAQPSPAAAEAEADTVTRTPQRRYWRALLLNLTLNASWSILFWRTRRPDLATLDSALLAVSTGQLARRAAAVRPRYGWSLVPYLVWCCFATALSGSIARRNR